MSQQTRALEAQNRDLADKGAKLEARVRDTAAALEKADANTAEQQRKLDSAEAAYGLEPNEKSASAVGAERTKLELVQICARRPRAEHEAALEAFASWQAEYAAAEGELAAAREADRIDDLRSRASVAAFDAATADDYETLLRAQQEAFAAAAEIERKFAAANAAASECGLPPLAPMHLFKAIALDHVSSTPDNVGSVLEGLLTGGHWGTSLVSAIAGNIQGSITARRRTTLLQDFPNVLAQLEAAFACRTADEAQEAVRATQLEQAGKKSAAVAAPVFDDPGESPRLRDMREEQREKYEAQRQAADARRAAAGAQP